MEVELRSGACITEWGRGSIRFSGGAAIEIDLPHRGTRTYREVAALPGRPNAARAVAATMAGNRFPPVIPCHGVVGSDGGLRGYGGVPEMKRVLLEREGAGT